MPWWDCWPARRSECFCRSGTEEQPILGPTVFHWDEMKAVKTKVGEVRSLCKQPTATLDQLEMHVSR